MKSFDKKLYLSSPTMHGEELAYMKEAYDTNWMSTVGENIDVIERDLPAMIGVKTGIALSSGTSALHLAVKLAKVQPGERVFCSDMTFAATVNPVSYEFGRQVFIDTDPETWNMDPDALEKAFEIYPDTRVVVCANLYGMTGRLDRIAAICESHNAILIEDAAESLGASFNGKMTGSFGKYNVISFNGNKIITGTSGGMLLTDDTDAAVTARKWSTQSREPAPWYQHEDLGYNYRMSNVIAGVVRGQMGYLNEHLAQKKAIYERYRDGFCDLPVSMNPIIDGCKPNYWLSCMILDPDVMCPQVRGKLDVSYTKQPGKTCPTEILEKLASYNAEGRPIWKPMHLQPVYADCELITRNGILNRDGTEKDVGLDIFTRGLCLPSDNKMTPEQQDNVIEIVRSCFN